MAILDRYRPASQLDPSSNISATASPSCSSKRYRNRHHSGAIRLDQKAQPATIVEPVNSLPWTGKPDGGVGRRHGVPMIRWKPHRRCRERAALAAFSMAAWIPPATGGRPARSRSHLYTKLLTGGVSNELADPHTTAALALILTIHFTETCARVESSIRVAAPPVRSRCQPRFLTSQRSI